MVLALSLLLRVAALCWREVPVGTTVHLRLPSAVASYSSRAGTPVRAVVIAPIEARGEMVVPARAQVHGRVISASRVGLGIVHERAALDVRFESLGTVPARGVPLSARLVEVDNSRERVLPSGTIQGIRTTSTVSYRVGGCIRTFIGWHIQSSLAFWLVRSLLVQVPEPEIYYPAGSELTLALSEPLRMPGETQTTRLRSITPDEVDRIASTLNSLPSRAHAPVSGRLSDLLNVVVM